MSSCPICGKLILREGGGEYDCEYCQKDFQDGKFKFNLPCDLNREHFVYFDYVEMSRFFFKLKCCLISPEEYDKEIQKIVAKINARGNTSPAQLAAIEQRRRSREYAAKLMRH